MLRGLSPTLRPMRRLFGGFAFGLGLAATPAQARPERIAVFPLRTAQEAAPALDKALGEAAQRVRPAAEVLDAAAVQAITSRIAAAGLEAVQTCGEVDCALDLGGALGVDEVLLCNSEGTAEEPSLTLLRIDMRRGRILARGHRAGAAAAVLPELMQEVLGTARPASADAEAEVHLVTSEDARAFDVRSRGSDPQPCAVTNTSPCVLFLPAAASALQLKTEGYPPHALSFTPKSGVQTYAVRTTGHTGLFTASIFGSLVGAGMVIGGSVDLARGIEPTVPAVSLSVGTVLLGAAVYGIYSMYPSVETIAQ